MIHSPSEVRKVGEALEDIEFIQEWGNLCRDLDTSFFLTPKWVEAWWRWAGAPSGRVAIWRGADRRVEAVIALVRVRERLHPKASITISVLTNLGSGAGSADHHGWAAIATRIPDVWGWVREQSRTTSVLLRSLSPVLAEQAPAGVSRVSIARCPRLSLERSASGIGSGSFQKRLRYYERRLINEGVSFRWCPPGVLDEGAIDLLYQLHDERHSLKEEVSTFRASQADLHRRIVRASGPGQDGPAALIAELGGEPIGILYGFLTRSTFAYFQSGWSAEWADRNLGTVMTAQAIRHAVEAGADTFDFLRGPEPYKYRFGAEDLVDTTLLMPSGLSGRLLSLKYRMRASIST